MGAGTLNKIRREARVLPAAGAPALPAGGACITRRVRFERERRELARRMSERSLSSTVLERSKRERSSSDTDTTSTELDGLSGGAVTIYESFEPFLLLPRRVCYSQLCAMLA